MNKIYFGIILIMMPTLVIAGDAENISACVNKAQKYSGVVLNDFDVSYEGNWIAMSIAKWNNAYCEVKLGEVLKLEVNEKLLVVDGFSGQDSLELNGSLQGKTDAAINRLNARIALLQQRMENVTEKLKQTKPNHKELTEYIDDGIEKAFGKPN